jgi:hypothetical protein
MKSAVSPVLVFFGSTLPGTFSADSRVYGAVATACACNKTRVFITPGRKGLAVFELIARVTVVNGRNILCQWPNLIPQKALIGAATKALPGQVSRGHFFVCHLRKYFFRCVSALLRYHAFERGTLWI